MRASVLQKVEEKIDELLDQHLTGSVVEDRDYRGLIENLRIIFPTMPEAIDSEDKLRKANRGKLKKSLLTHAEEIYSQREDELGGERMRALERILMLRALDLGWKAQLTDIEKLRQGIGLQAYGQRNPLVAYQREGRRMYQDLLTQMRDDVVHGIYRLTLAPANARSGTPPNGRARRAPSPQRRRPSQNRPQRPLLLRQRQEVQALLRQKLGPLHVHHQRRTRQYI